MDYDQTRDCIYKNERYSVRNNGTVLRYPHEGKRLRPTDNQWTFGKPNTKTGYMEIASVRVHRIVAFAFHGEPPTKEHVVDHIDTNKKNNRPENLRWITRLENVLLNPITAKRIAYVCGSVEAFLADPVKYRDQFSEPHEQWMQTVNKEEAETSLKRMLAWVESDKTSSGGSLDKWIFTRHDYQNRPAEIVSETPDYIMSLTPGAAQIRLSIYDKPNKYPCTPQAIEGDPLQTYLDNLIEGAVFFTNHNGSYLVLKSGISENGRSLIVMTKAAYVWKEQENGDYLPIPINELSENEYCDKGNYSLAEVTYRDHLFIHGKTECGFHPKEELERIFTDYTKGLS